MIFSETTSQRGITFTEEEYLVYQYHELAVDDVIAVR
jgi:hypothetical protein